MILEDPKYVAFHIESYMDVYSPFGIFLEDTGWAVYVGRVQKGTPFYLFQRKYFEPGIVNDDTGYRQ